MDASPFMDLQTITGLIQGLLVLVLLLVGLNLYLVFRWKDIDPFRKWNPHAINGSLFFLFFIVGMLAAVLSTNAWSDTFTLLNNPASEHGVEIDRMQINTTWVAVFVSVVTNFLLFYFAWRYRAKRGRKALFYPHNNRLEVIWTAVPAVVLTLLVFDGVNVWHDIWEDPPADAIEIEVNGKQFGWTYRYPGADMQYGETSVGFMNDASGNELGFNFRDRNGHDDIVSSGAIDTIYFPVNKTVNLTIKSRDVLHSATLAHFRVKMDAVPGMPTRFTFKPILTTEEMRKQTGNPKFNYEMSCQQICGGGHWNMRRVIKVVEYDEYQSWLTKQTPFFTQWRGMTPANEAMGKEFAEAVEAANEEEPTVTLAE